ncbi:MAG: hypothetical protein MR531_17885, partial [Lachnospiraceae bacterium]|nr:hypothetical protein [Lachnospiraceae bacterium]
MNREQRRRQAKEQAREQRRPNSKRNFVSGGIQSISIDDIQHDENLKECDSELLDLMMESYKWRIKSQVANGIISYGFRYLDSLCSLRFDITPVEDKILIRDTMGHVSNMANWFMGNCIDEDNRSISEKAQEAHEIGIDNVRVTMPEGAEHYELKPLPELTAIDDVSAEYVVKHANEIAPLLVYAKPSDI